MISARTWRDRAAGALVGARLIARALTSPRPRPVAVADRLRMIPEGLPVRDTVLIHWDAHQIPFIEARNDDDLATALGVVHAHLRLGQMEMLRRLAHGRVAELVGPLGVEVDRSLRLFAFGRAVPAIIDGLAAPTRRWAEHFLAGVNHIVAFAPPCDEFQLLDIPRTPWTMTDLFTTVRLAAADVNWLMWPRLLRARRRLGPARWDALWRVLLRDGVAPPAAVDAMLGGIGSVVRAGSNAAVIAGRRGANGAGMLAADPHLSVALPNIWLACCLRSPDMNVVGLMPAGFPVVAIGRNPWLAWGGTSLHGDSSDLFDARGQVLTMREETIAVRGGRPRTVRLRDSPLGPIVSDGLLLRHASPLALRWMGHAASDEVGALLGAMRARTAEEFQAAFSSFSVPAQNMLHAGRDGRIGYLTGAAMPDRGRGAARDVVCGPGEAAAWDRTVTAADLPRFLDPADGFIASANDRPPPGPVRVGTFFSPSIRADRMRKLLAGARGITMEDLAALQADVTPDASSAMRDAVLSRMSAEERAHPVAKTLAGWDGAYSAASVGALVFEVVVADLARRLIAPARRAALAAVWTGRETIAEEVLAAPSAALRRAMPRALRRAARVLARWQTWGGAHRLVLRHPFALFPLIGRRYRFGDFPADGANDTLNKSGHKPVRGKHRVSFGASARFIADLATPNANRVVLLGGQDGWIGSDTFLDQVPLWRRGETIELPLEAERARAWPHHTVHPPSPAPEPEGDG